MRNPDNIVHARLTEIKQALDNATEEINGIQIILGEIHKTTFSVKEVKALMWCQSVGWEISEGGITANTDLSSHETVTMLRKAFGNGLIPSKGLLKNDEDEQGE